MTISTSIRTAGPFIGNGVTVAFPFSYKVFARADVLVARTITATSVETILVLDADYTITLNPDQDAVPGGVITLTAPLATGTTLAATSNLPIQQSLDLTNNGGFYPTVINDALDRIVITIQQLAARVGAGALNVGAAAGLATVLNFIANLAANTAAGLIGTLSGDSVQKFINRTPARLGRVAGTDLPRLMALLRNYRADTRPIIPIVGFGSSVGVGATLATPLVDAPVAWFKSQLKAYFDPGNLYNLVPYNYCVNGSTISDFPAAWAAMLAAGITGPGVAVMAYGMNDQAPAQYNNGQTFPGFYTAFRSAVMTMKKAGWDVVILTTPHASIVLNPGIHSMPAGIPQVYPFAVAANVAPEAMSPPASQSKIVADFIGEGVSISVDHRALRINQSMRDVAKEFGCTLIDSERYWFEALQKYQIQTGSAAGAEGILFNPGETVHPNLVGHQSSYQPAITDFVKSLAWQSAQNNITPRLNGYFGVNTGDNLPAAIMEIGTPYPDQTSTALLLKQRTGVVDANSIKAEEKWFQLDPATGDILHGDFSTGGGWRQVVTRTTDRALTATLSRIGKAYGVTFTEWIEGASNIQIATPYTTKPLPASSVGELAIAGENTGVGTSPQMKKYRWKTDGTTITLVADGADIGSLVFTVAVSGLTLVITAVANNTNFQVRWTSLGT